VDEMKTMTNNLLKNLIAATVIVLTVGVSGVWAQELESKLPKCKGKEKSNWNDCYGIEIIADEILEGKWVKGKKNGRMNVKDKISKSNIGFLNYIDGELHGETLHQKNGVIVIGNYNHGVIEGLIYGKVKDTESVDMESVGYIVGTNNENLIGIKSFHFQTKDNGVKQFYLVQANKKSIVLKKEGGEIIIGIDTIDGFVAYENKEYEINELKKLIKKIKVNNPNIFKISKKYEKIIDKDFLYYLELEDIFDDNKNKLNLQITNTQPNNEGDFVVNIQTGTDTASLKINGEEQGGRADGNYIIKKVARAGQETKFTIVAKDTNGNIDSKTIAVTRQVTASSQIKYAELNPALVKTQTNKDAVAIIIGIADYKNLPRADFANDDARAFYDYAIRALGVKAENIKLLVDADAGQGEIYKAFKTWLPSRVKATTDVYVYYSGHGLPAADGQSLYLLPQLADRDLIEETAIAQSKINAAIQAAKPKSVTIFLDSCYSGAGRTGATLLASARPIAIKSTAQAFPAEFTVISASTAEQISSSSNELKHGIFSYYLMRGMEGDADTNKDGKITTGEMHTYLIENVTRQASLANRVQQPQLSGDANRVLVGK